MLVALPASHPQMPAPGLNTGFADNIVDHRRQCLAGSVAPLGKQACPPRLLGGELNTFCLQYSWCAPRGPQSPSELHHGCSPHVLNHAVSARHVGPSMLASCSWLRSITLPAPTFVLRNANRSAERDRCSQFRSGGFRRRLRLARTQARQAAESLVPPDSTRGFCPRCSWDSDVVRGAWPAPCGPSI